MSAKDTADAILRDFRTSMATEAKYICDSAEAAEEVFAELFDMIGPTNGIEAWGNGTEVLYLCVIDSDERSLSI